MADINIPKDLLVTQARAVEEERSRVNKELKERQMRVDQLRKKYEIVMFSLAPPDGGEQRSQAYYLVQAAQEREELQRQVHCVGNQRLHPMPYPCTHQLLILLVD